MAGTAVEHTSAWEHWSSVIPSLRWIGWNRRVAAALGVWRVWPSRVATKVRVIYQHRSRSCSRLLTSTVAVRKRATVEDDALQAMRQFKSCSGSTKSHVSLSLRVTNEESPMRSCRFPVHLQYAGQSVRKIIFKTSRKDSKR